MQKKLYFCRRINVFFAKKLKNMVKKSNSTTSKWRFMLYHLIAAICVGVILIIGLVIGLRNFTQHGQEVVVPNIITMHIEEARIFAAAEGLNIAVIDSTYSSKTPLGTIVEQNPRPGSHVKHGRTIYVIQNARFRRPVILPELRDLSLRQAETTIKTLGLNIAEIIYEPSTFKNILLDVRVCDSSMLAGTRLEEGTPLTLVVGKGKGVENVNVPYIVGKSIEEARSWLLANSLTLGSVEYDVEPTEETNNSYIIYQQDPTSGMVVVEGTSVNIKLSTNIEKTISTGEEDTNEEDFW